jgi:hypothetical protein
MTLALSVRQPWPWAMFFAGKGVENRDWPTKVLGRVLIHASKGMTHEEYEDFLDTAHVIRLRHPFPSGVALPAFGELPRGGIVGEAEIVDCVSESDSPWFFGKFGFVLRNAKPLPFRPYKGRLGFFDVDEGALYGKATP